MCCERPKHLGYNGHQWAVLDLVLPPHRELEEMLNRDWFTSVRRILVVNGGAKASYTPCVFQLNLGCTLGEWES